MSRDITGRDIDRRDILKGLGVAGMAGLAGCAGGDSTPTPNQGEDDGGDDSTPEPTATPEKLGDTLVNPDGDQVTLTAVYSTGGQTTETTMEFIKQELGKVGIRVELTGTQFQSMLANYAQNSTEDGSATFNGGPRDESTSSNQWDLMGGIGFNSYPRTPSSIRPFWIDVENPGASVNFYGYKPSKAIQPKVDEASSTTDPEQRQSLFAEIFGTLSRDQPVNFLTFSNDLLGFRSNVSGLGEAVFGFGYQSQSRYFGSGVAAVGGSYTNGAASGAKTLNPIRSNDTSSDARIGLTMDGAYTLDPQNNFVPRWFESVESNDALDTYTFTLRDNLQWSGNYGQMTADDWVYYIQNVRQAEPNWTGDVNHGDWFRTVDGEQQPIEVSAPSELKLQVSLPDTDPAFVSKPVLWGAYCMPRGLIEPYYERVQDASSEEAKIEIGNELNEDEEVQTLAYTGNLGPFDYERWDRTSVFVSTRGLLRCRHGVRGRRPVLRAVQHPGVRRAVHAAGRAPHRRDRLDGAPASTGPGVRAELRHQRPARAQRVLWDAGVQPACQRLGGAAQARGPPGALDGRLEDDHRRADQPRHCGAGVHPPARVLALVRQLAGDPLRRLRLHLHRWGPADARRRAPGRLRVPVGSSLESSA